MASTILLLGLPVAALYLLAARGLAVPTPSFALLVLSFISYVVYNIVIWPKYISPLRQIPLAPGSHFFYGHLKRLLKEPSGTPPREWIENVPNNGVIRYHMWFQTRLLVTKPDTLAEVLVTRSDDYVKSSLVRNALERVTGDGLLLLEGEEHKAQRKALMPAFTFRHIKGLYPVFWRKARELVQCIERASQSGDPQHKPNTVEMSDWAARVTLDIIGVCGMGKDFNFLQDPNSELVRAYRDVFARGIASPTGKLLQLLRVVLPNSIVTRIPIQHNHIINTAMRYVRNVCQEIITERRLALSARKENPSIDILSVALESQSFTDPQLVDHLMTFFAAGHETSATALTAALILLCRHPDIQTRLRAAIRASVPRGLTGEITPEEIEGCHYLQAVCSEVLRIWPAVTFGFRTARRDTVLAGIRVPRGSSIALCPWAVNASTELWGEDAQEFKPGRWLDANGRAKASEAAFSNYSFLTFFHGPRSCIGQRFAQSEFACLLAACIGTFKFEFEEGSALSRGEAEMKGSITVKPEGGAWCTIEKIPGWE